MLDKKSRQEPAVGIESGRDSLYSPRHQLEQRRLLWLDREAARILTPKENPNANNDRQK